MLEMAALAPRLLQDHAAAFSGVYIDSRQVIPGALFIAIRGDRCDGHDFIREAILRGARGIIHSKNCTNLEVEQWQVSDTIAALATLATAFRDLHACATIAVTGSNGKTSVKNMIAAILPPPSFATPGNFNNHIGVPMSVLQLNFAHKYAVFELGANHIGEIQHTVAIVKPDVALINNIAPAHLAGFGDIAGVTRAKCEIYQGLAPGKVAVVNDDDAQAASFAYALEGLHVIRFSKTHAASVYATDINVNAAGMAAFNLIMPQSDKLHVQLQVPGMHQVSNALAAAACTYALNIAPEIIAAKLSTFTGVPGRLNFCVGLNNATIIDDTYNANLYSALSAVDVLSARTGKRIFVLGDMGELGQDTMSHHHELGKAARLKGIDQLFTCGKHSLASAMAFGEHAQHYEHKQDLVYALRKQLDANTTVLVKGSRLAAMEEIVKQLQEC